MILKTTVGQSWAEYCESWSSKTINHYTKYKVRAREVIKKEAEKEGRQPCDRYKHESCRRRMRNVLRKKRAQEKKTVSRI